MKTRTAYLAAKTAFDAARAAKNAALAVAGYDDARIAEVIGGDDDAALVAFEELDARLEVEHRMGTLERAVLAAEDALLAEFVGGVARAARRLGRTNDAADIAALAATRSVVARERLVQMALR